MANAADAGKALQTAQKPVGIQGLINQSIKELGRALPDHLSAERLARIALTCVRMNPDLTKCTPESFMGALFTSAQLGVEPVAGRAYILPFNNSRKQADGSWKSIKEAQFVMGYKGLADLFYRHEKAVQLDWGAVHEGDNFQYEYGTTSFLKHVPALKNRGPVIAYYVVASLQGGGKPFMVMSVEDCMEHGKKHSKTWLTKEWSKEKNRYVECTPHWAESSPWATSTDSMCLKTVLVQLAKILPLSVQLQRAIAADETSREFRQGIDDALDLPDTTTWEDQKSSAVETDAIEPIEPKGA